jgi:hypothetical protein
MENNKITNKVEKFLNKTSKEETKETVKVINNNDGLIDLNEVINKTVKSSDGRTLLREVTNY